MCPLRGHSPDHRHPQGNRPPCLRGPGGAPHDEANPAEAHPRLTPPLANGLRRSPPEPFACHRRRRLSATAMQGLADRLDAVLAAGRAPSLHGLVVEHDGDLALEWYGSGEDHSWGTSHGVIAFGPETLHDI